jgi:cytochrome c
MDKRLSRLFFALTPPGRAPSQAQGPRPGATAQGCRHHRAAAAAALALAAALSASPPAAASEALAAKAGCVACHAVDRKGVGPSYREIAARYKGDPKAAALMAQRVRKGGSGVWGPVPMPPTPPERLSDADLKLLVAWLLKA